MKNKKKKETNINLITIWKMFRSNQGKKISFGVFYLFFFIFLFILIYSSPSKVDKNQNPNEVKEQVETSLPFKTLNLENNDYNFKYIITSNLDELEYLVSKQNNTIMVNDDTGIFEYNYKNGVLVTTSNKKIIHEELLSIYEFKRIIKNSKIISETKLSETNEYIYAYKITNSNLSNIFRDYVNNKELENDIIVTTNHNKEIKEINLDLLNYEKEINNSLTHFMIKIIIGDSNE